MAKTQHPTKLKFANVLQVLPLLLLLLTVVEATTEHNSAKKVVADKATSSAFLNKHRSLRSSGCQGKPGACGEGKTCCNNVCVDLNIDANNCGGCRFRCPFNWKCCGGSCTYTEFNPSHCGSCGVRCPIGTFCYFGMCGYAHQLPPMEAADKKPTSKTPSKAPSSIHPRKDLH